MATSPKPSPFESVDLMAMMLVFWAVSLVRVVLAVLRHEKFGGEATLAIITVLVIPGLIGPDVWKLLRRRRPR
jgi:hypothetical protein